MAAFKRFAAKIYGRFQLFLLRDRSRGCIVSQD